MLLTARHSISMVMLQLVLFNAKGTAAFNPTRTSSSPLIPMVVGAGGKQRQHSPKQLSFENQPLRRNDLNHSHLNRNNYLPHDIHRLNLMKPSLSSSTTAAVVATTASNDAISTQIKVILSAVANANAGTTALQAVKELLINTSPSIYFLCLILAGMGLPLSEDALCIFVGSILPLVWNENPGFRTKLLLALYFGIVLSDCITFSIGKVMGKGFLEPVRKRLNIRSERVTFCEDDDESEEITDEELELSLLELENIDEGDDPFCEIETPDLRTTDKEIAILEKVGVYAGFVVRFSVGMRLPMMLAAGFSGKVPLSRFVLGTSIGAIFSLSIQLLLGAVMRDNPAMIIATIACISATPIVIPSLIAFLSWINIRYKRWAMYRPRGVS